MNTDKIKYFFLKRHHNIKLYEEVDIKLKYYNEEIYSCSKVLNTFEQLIVTSPL